MYWLPKLHKQPYKHRFIANSSFCSTTTLSKLLTSCLKLIKDQTIKLCEKIYETSGKNLFWSIKNSNEVLQKLKLLNHQAKAVSSYDFSTLYTSLPHDLIKQKLTDLIKKTFKSVKCDFVACNEKRAFFTSNTLDTYTIWTCQELCDSLTFLLDNIFVRFGNKVFKQVIGIPMGTNCAPLVADLFLYCYERDFMLNLSCETQSEVIDAFNNTSRYLDDLLNIENGFFQTMYKDIYPKELTLCKANTDDHQTSFLDLDLNVENNTVVTKIYDKRDDFNFEIVNFPFLDGDVPKCTSYGVYISQLIRFARACSKIEDFNSRNLHLTSKLLKQGYRYHKLCKEFAKFHRKYKDLISKYSSSLKSLIQDGICMPEFYGDVVYKLRKITGYSDFSSKFEALMRSFLKKGYRKNILKRTVYLVLHPFTVHKFSHLF